MTCPEADEQIKADLEEQVGVAGREALIYGLLFVTAAMFLYFELCKWRYSVSALEESLVEAHVPEAPDHDEKPAEKALLL